MLEQLKGGLAVSCQAHEGEPLQGDQYMAKMALAAQMGGAVAIRANGPTGVRAVKAEVDLPVIAIYKRSIPGADTYITPDLESAGMVIEAGADIVALDCTRSRNHKGERGIEIIKQIREAYKIIIMAEISVFEEAQEAYEAGADIISTTLSGYTPYSPQLKEPDFQLIGEIRKRLLDAYINAEGRISTPAQLRQAFQLGADMATVGGAITRPQWITRQFVDAIE